MAKTKVKGSSRKRQVRVAFIGAGGRARLAHYPSIRDLPDAQAVALCDLDEDLMNTVGDEYKIKGRYTDYKKMIETENPDMVICCMPPQLLFNVAATVMDMGTNLIIEKPPAVTSEQARQLAIIAKRKKVLTGVTFQRRYSPMIRIGKQMCEKKGPVHTAVATFYKNAVGEGPYYQGAIDILTCDAIHAVDTLRYLCDGEVVAVASDVRRLYA